jgi:hypothetical protein
MRSPRALACLALVLLASCASQPVRSTRLTDADLDEMSGELASKLRTSDWLATRAADSPRAVITWDKVENLTNDLLSRGEQWAMMTKVRDGAGLVQLSRDKNLAVVLPAQFLEEGRERGAFEPEFAVYRAPTHRLDATLRSATRADGRDRTDLYLCDVRVTDLATGAVEFTDTVTIKRAAVGLSFD